MKKIIIVVFFFVFQINYAQSIEHIKVYKNDSLYISYINPFLSPIEFKFKVKDSLKGKLKVKDYMLLQAKDTATNIFVIPKHMIVDTSKVNTKDYAKISGQFGSPNHKPNLEHIYTLPFPKKSKYKIIQGFGGKFSHSSKHSKYAIDFSTQIGDTITAARDGIVIFTKDDSQEQGGREAMNKANKIIVMHDDGTYAHYVHLDYKGLLVSVGDSISVGQAIGISGYTGFTTTPHLHFVVMKYGSEAIPIYFKGYEGKKLKQGKRYKRNL